MQFPNFCARVYSPGPLCSRILDRRSNCAPLYPHPLSDVQNSPPRCLRLHAADSPDLFSLGQSVFAAGTQTIEKLSRQFQPLPAGFPPGPRGDVALRLLANPLTFLEETRRTFGPLVGMLLGGEHVVLIADPDVAEHVLIKANNAVAKEGTAFFPGSRLAGNGLLVSDGALWQRQRQLSNPAFRKAAVEAYLQAMSRGAVRLTSTTWAGGGRREVYANFNDLTLQIVTDVLFGFQSSTPESKNVTAAVRVAMEYFASRAATGFAIPEWLPTPDNVEYNNAVARLDELVFRIIRQRRAMPNDAAASHKCLLDNLLAAVDEDGRGMSDRALRDELMTLLIAGQETSAIVLAWACALLAHNPVHQAAAHEEVTHVLDGAVPGPTNIGSLHFLEAVVLEAMRLLPPAYMVGRCCTQQLRLGSYIVPKGTTLLVSPYLLHRMAERWPQSREFRPQRWLPHLRSDKPGAFMSLFSGLGPNGAYLPFGAGPRNCVGNYFAMEEVVLVLAHVLQSFALEPLPGADFPKADAKITLRPQSVWLALSRRS